MEDGFCQLQHKRQQTSFSCGAASVAMLLGISEKEAREGCKTKKKGTNSENVLRYLQSRGIEAHRVWLHIAWDEYSRWLFLNSQKRKLYLGCIIVSNCGRGRNRERHHGIAVSNGFVLDPAEPQPVPIEAYPYVSNRKIIIKYMIFWDIYERLP